MADCADLTYAVLKMDQLMAVIVLDNDGISMVCFCWALAETEATAMSAMMMVFFILFLF